MQNTKIFRNSRFAGLLLLFGCFVLANCNSKKKKEDPVKNITVYRFVDVSEIKKAFAATKGGKINLNVYPVKKTDSVNVNDWDLLFTFQDLNEPYNILGNQIDEKVLAGQSANYIGYLKAGKIPKEEIPHGYFIPLTYDLVNNASGVSISFMTGPVKMNYCILGGSSDGNAGTSRFSDSCKCPPDCCGRVELKCDSIGKCPPMCPTQIFFGDDINAIISKVYQ